MSRTSRSLAVLATVALIGAGGLSSFAATRSTASEKGSSAPGTLPSKGSSGSKKGSSSAPGPPAPGPLPSKGSSGSKRWSPLAPGPPAPR
jgi:hypothetical protein